MTIAQRITVLFTTSLIIIVIVFVLSVVNPAFSATMYKDEYNNSNLNLPGLTEDRYTGESRTNIVTLIESIIPVMLPGTSGQGVCNVDITCDSNGNAVK